MSGSAAVSTASRPAVLANSSRWWSGSLVERLDRHVRREQTWVTHDEPIPCHPDLQSWALSLLTSDEINIDALPEGARERLHYAVAGPDAS